MSEGFPTKKGRVMGRQMVVTRTQPGAHRMSMGVGAGGGIIQSRQVRLSMGAPVLSAGMSSQASSAVNAVIDTRDKEKKDLGLLNDRFASYVEKVTMIEAQNQMLLAEVERLKKLKGFDVSSIKEKYENELQCLRDEFTKGEADKCELNAELLTAGEKIEMRDKEIDKLKKDLAAERSKTDKLNAEISDYEAECCGLRRNADTLESDVKRLNELIATLKEDLDRLLLDLQNETVQRLKEMNDAQAKEEQMGFDNDVLLAEVTALRELLDQDHMPKMKAQMQGHFKDAINSLREENADQIAKIKANYEIQLESKIQQLQAGINKDNMDATIAKETSKKLKSQLGSNQNLVADLNARLIKLQAERDALEKDLEELREEFDEERRCCSEEKAKLANQIECLQAEIGRLEGWNLDLGMEITTYRKLLDGRDGSLRNIVEQVSGAQSRGGAALAGLIMEGGSSGGGDFGQSQQQSSMSKESMGTFRVQKQSSCPIHITEHEVDGSCVKIANTSKGKTMQLKGWRLERKFKRAGRFITSSYRFGDCTLSGGKTLNLWAKNFKSYAKGDDDSDIICECETWGSGDGRFSLFDENEKERASCTITFE